MAARSFSSKKSLTPREKVKVAYAYLIRGVDQHTIASMFEVNAGRVAEAVKEIRAAVDWPMGENNPDHDEADDG